MAGSGFFDLFRQLPRHCLGATGDENAVIQDVLIRHRGANKGAEEFFVVRIIFWQRIQVFGHGMRDKQAEEVIEWSFGEFARLLICLGNEDITHLDNVLRTNRMSGFRRGLAIETLLRTPIPKQREALREQGVALTAKSYFSETPRRGIMPT